MNDEEYYIETELNKQKIVSKIANDFKLYLETECDGISPKIELLESFVLNFYKKDLELFKKEELFESILEYIKLEKDN